MKKYLILAAIVLLPLSTPIYAVNAVNPVDELLAKYRLQGADAFSTKVKNCGIKDLPIKAKFVNVAPITLMTYATVARRYINIPDYGS